MTKIQRKRARILNKLNTAYEELAALQDSCPHTHVTKEYKSNAGNYDPHADSYWIDFKCPECGKNWSEDQ